MLRTEGSKKMDKKKKNKFCFKDRPNRKLKKKLVKDNLSCVVIIGGQSWRAVPVKHVRFLPSPGMGIRMGRIEDPLLTVPMGHFKGSLHFLAFLLALQHPGLIVSQAIGVGVGACLLA